MDDLLIRLTNSCLEGRDREEDYEALTALVKENDSIVREHHLSLLTDFVCKDLNGTETATTSNNLKEKCLGLVGAILHSRHCASILTPSQCTALTDTLCAVIISEGTTTTATVRKLAVWCIEVQVLPPERLSMKIAESICNHVLSNTQPNTNTESLEYEALGAVDKLLFHTENIHLETRPELWAPPVWKRALSPSSSPQLRGRAFGILSATAADPARIVPNLSRLLYTALGNDLHDTYAQLITQCQSPGRSAEECAYPAKLWGVLAALLGDKVLHGKTAQRFLRFPQGFFAHTGAEVRAAAFDAWAAPVRLFARMEKKNKKKHQKVLELLCKPLLFMVAKDAPVPLHPLVAAAALRTWNCLVECLPPDLVEANYDALFTQFGMVVAREVPEQASTVLGTIARTLTTCQKEVFGSCGETTECERAKDIAEVLCATVVGAQETSQQKLCSDAFRIATGALSVKGLEVFIEKTLLNDTVFTEEFIRRNTQLTLDMYAQVSTVVEDPQTSATLTLKLMETPLLNNNNNDKKAVSKALCIFEDLVATTVNTSVKVPPEVLTPVLSLLKKGKWGPALAQDLWAALSTHVKEAPSTPEALFCAELLGTAFTFGGISGGPAETKSAEGDWDAVMTRFASVDGLCEHLCEEMCIVWDNVFTTIKASINSNNGPTTTTQTQVLQMHFAAAALHSFVVHTNWEKSAGTESESPVFCLAAKALLTAHVCVGLFDHAEWIRIVLEAVSTLLGSCYNDLPQAVASSANGFAEALAEWANEPLPQSTGRAAEDDAVASVKAGMISLLESFLGSVTAFVGLGRPVDLTRLLSGMDGPLSGCLRSKHRKVKTAAVDMWNATFGAAVMQKFEYPPLVYSALADLRKAKTPLALPFWKEITCQSPIEHSKYHSEDSSDTEDDTTGCGSNNITATSTTDDITSKPKDAKQNQMEVDTVPDDDLKPPEPKKKKKVGPVTFGDNRIHSQYAYVETEPKKPEELIITEHQKEVMARRPDMPKTYGPLDPPTLNPAADALGDDEKETLSFGNDLDKDLCCTPSSAVDDFLLAARRILENPQSFCGNDRLRASEVLKAALQIANKTADVIDTQERQRTSK